MYTGTIFNWHDNSAFEAERVVSDVTNRPLFMVVNSFDKGPEKLMEVDANTFNPLFGSMSFDKHGQGSIQAQNIINAGGRLFIKRVCAADAEIANSLLVAKVTGGKQLQKVDGEGQYLYLDPDGNETTNATYIDDEGVVHDNEKVMVTGATISWSVKKVEGAKTFEDVKKAAKELIATGSYPVFAIADNGRGLSNKAIRIIPDYDTSRGLQQMIYRLNVYEGTTLLESINISLDPNYKFDDEYYGLDKNRNIQISGEAIPAIFDQFVNYLASQMYTGAGSPTEEEVANLKKMDLIYGYSYTGNLINYMAPEVDENGELVGVDFSVNYGVPFEYKGSNGSYGDTPADPDNASVYETWANDIAGVYKGIDTDGSNIDEVWDVDMHKIFAVADANYPLVVKDAIAEFVIFRKDCVYFRDLGLGYNTLVSIKARYNEITSGYKERNKSSAYDVRSNFISDYLTTYEIEDPTSKKNIEVTMMYDFVTALVNMYITDGPFVPLAGTYNGFVLGSAIPGTVNYTPIITPSINQKEVIDNLRINYAIFEDETTCVVQSTYSSQAANTQLSYICNTLAIQEVARSVRTACPKNRFALVTGNDMSIYATAVRRVLEGFSSYFSTLDFSYTQDPLKVSQKIFYASINFSFANWAQTEIFDLYAISNVSAN